jgi:RNA polymerase sigma factor (TIGR02999 family)
MTSATRRTDVLEQLRGGRESLDGLVAILYDELRDIAHRHRAARGDLETLATTALVHEAYLKLVDQSSAHWNDRAHFLSLAAIAMRHILVDRAKARMTVKRGSGAVAGHDRR